MEAARVLKSRPRAADARGVISVSPTTDAAGPAQVLAEAWQRYAAAAAARVDVIEEAAAALADGALGGELREDAAREAHRLAGSLGMFGVPAGSGLALECEELLRAEGPLYAPDGARLASLARGIRRELADGAGPGLG
jgi:HPt (histidine-containing phosphotransfer) domain-containing protein